MPMKRRAFRSRTSGPILEGRAGARRRVRAGGRRLPRKPEAGHLVRPESSSHSDSSPAGDDDLPAPARRPSGLAHRRRIPLDRRRLHPAEGDREAVPAGPAAKPPFGARARPYSISTSGSELRSLAASTRRPALLLNEPAAPSTPDSQKSAPRATPPLPVSPSRFSSGSQSASA